MTTEILFRFTILFIMVFTSTFDVFGQALLKIRNNSEREMFVKVIQDQFSHDRLHDTVYIRPNGTRTIYFTETGNYYTKTKASLRGRDPVYRKGDPFRGI